MIVEKIIFYTEKISLENRTGLEFKIYSTYHNYKLLGGKLSEEDYYSMIVQKHNEEDITLSEMTTANYIELIRKAKKEKKIDESMSEKIKDYSLHERIIQKYLHYFRNKNYEFLRKKEKRIDGKRINFLLLYEEAYKILGINKKILFSKLKKLQ